MTCRYYTLCTLCVYSEVCIHCVRTCVCDGHLYAWIIMRLRNTKLFMYPFCVFSPRMFNSSMSRLTDGKKPWVTKLSSAGLVYLHFGHRVIATIVGTWVGG